jgi:hypothetical protein
MERRDDASDLSLFYDTKTSFYSNPIAMDPFNVEHEARLLFAGTTACRATSYAFPPCF